MDTDSIVFVGKTNWNWSGSKASRGSDVTISKINCTGVSNSVPSNHED